MLFHHAVKTTKPNANTVQLASMLQKKTCTFLKKLKYVDLSDKIEKVTEPPSSIEVKTGTVKRFFCSNYSTDGRMFLGVPDCTTYGLGFSKAPGEKRNNMYPVTFQTHTNGIMTLSFV